MWSLSTNHRWILSMGDPIWIWHSGGPAVFSTESALLRLTMTRQVYGATPVYIGFNLYLLLAKIYNFGKYARLSVCYLPKFTILASMFVCRFVITCQNYHFGKYRWGIILRSTVRTYDISWFSLLPLLQNGSQTDPRFRFAQKTASEKVFSSILAANKCCQSTAGYVSFETK